MGASVASFLAEASPGDPILIVERDPSFEFASSARSASSIRQQFSTPVNVQLSQFSFEYLRRCGPKERPGLDVGLVEQGYLFLADPMQEPALRERTRLATRAGASISELDQDALAGKFSWLNVADVSYGAIGDRGEGWFDGYALMQTFRTNAHARGVRSLKGNVTRIDTKANRVTGVTLDDNTHIAASRIVIAGGAWSRDLALSVGSDLPVRARRRTVFVLTCPTALPGFPILIDGSGIFVRPEGNAYVCILSPSQDSDHDNLPMEPDYGQFEADIWPALAHRLPAFESLRVQRAWAGYYEYNTLDQNGIVGALGPENLFVATGFSGHGLMHSAGVGRGLAELMTDGDYQTIDLSPLSPDRFAQNRAIVETAIY